MTDMSMPGILMEWMNNRALWILVPRIAGANTLYGQESGIRDVTDSLTLKQSINQSLLRNSHSEIILPSSLCETAICSTGFLHQSITNLPSSLSPQFQQQIDVVSPWKQELMKQNEYQTLRLVLGALQVGATAYVLYEHIRKYGVK